MDFQAAISRRRATVDGDGETFESTPSVKTEREGVVMYGVSVPEDRWMVDR